MSSKRRIANGEVYIWTRRGWRLVRNGFIRTRRGWRKQRKPPQGTRSKQTPSPLSDPQPITVPAMPVAETRSHHRQWFGKYATLEMPHESEG